MGFFGRIFGGKDGDKSQAGSGTAAPAPNPWHRRANAIDWDWNNPQARALVHEVLNAAAPRFGNAMVKELPDDENIDLRGTFDGMPVRFAVWMSFGTFWAIEMKVNSALDELEIERDHEKIPKQKDAHDPWSENEERRIFVGKGIFVEGDDDDVATNLTAWSRLPEGLRGRILHDLEALDANSITVRSDAIRISQKPGMCDVPDFIGYMEGCARLMAEINRAVTTASGPAAIAPAPVQTGGMPADGGFTRVNCGYCSSMYILSLSRSHCPNCGAPASQ